MLRAVTSGQPFSRVSAKAASMIASFVNMALCVIPIPFNKTNVIIT